MNDEFESRVAAWLRDRARPDPMSLAAVLGTIEALPARRRGPRRGWLLATAAVLAVVAIGLTSVLYAPQPDGSAPSGPSRPVPPDPAAFTNDPRLAACFGAAGPVEFVFEMPRARDYQRHFPAMLLAPELDVDDPAFVVVFASGARLLVGGAGASASADTATSPNPNERFVCVLVGSVPNLYEDVDISSMRVDIGTGETTSSSPASSPVATPVVSASPTIEPAPSWASDLGGQLECDGPAPGLGGEVGELGAREPSPTPDAALQILLDARVFASLPAGGFDPALVEGHWARHEYRVDGRIRALAVTTDRVDGFPEGDGWHVVGIRACDAAEFDPADGLTFDQTLWVDRNGNLERSERIHSAPGPGHCGWDSTIFLRFEGVQYIRDPQGVLADATVVQFDADVALPDDAVDTGLHTGEWRLHTAAAGDAVYVVTRGGSVERWGRAKDEIGCM